MKRKRVTTINGRPTEMLVDEGPRQVTPHASYIGAGKHRAGRLVSGTTDLTPRPVVAAELVERDACLADHERHRERLEQERRVFRHAVIAEAGGTREIDDLFRVLSENGWLEFCHD